MGKSEIDLVLMTEEELQRESDKQSLDQFMKDKQRDNTESILKYRMCKIAREEVAKLPKEREQVVRLKFWDDCTDLEISKKMNLTIEHVQKILADTLEQLGSIIMESFLRQCKLSPTDALCDI